ADGPLPWRRKHQVSRQRKGIQRGSPAVRGKLFRRRQRAVGLNGDPESFETGDRKDRGIKRLAGRKLPKPSRNIAADLNTPKVRPMNLELGGPAGTAGRDTSAMRQVIERRRRGWIRRRGWHTRDQD